MVKEERIAAFISLKQELQSTTPAARDEIYKKAAAKNPWFTSANIDLAILSICHVLDHDNLVFWMQNYKTSEKPKNIGLIMAGNIPLVGFHDLLCVLLAGHNAIIKISSQDEVLPRYIIDLLIKIDPLFESKISIVDRLPRVDAVIATGSDNSSRYFKKYFSAIPHIIRKNRISVAILNGNESANDLGLLGSDIFSYYGLGCRNVAKVFVPQGYDMKLLLDHLDSYKNIIDHNKYFNNYEYNKAIYLVNKTKHLDTGYALFRSTTDLVSPLAVVYYEEYESREQLTATIEFNTDKIQCIVSKPDIHETVISFGQAQFPLIDDYADGVDTMAFLCDL